MRKFLLPAAILALTTASAQAHILAGEPGGLAHGLTHPLLGPDHLLAMLAVGLWASILGGRALWLVPLGFVSAMAASAALAVSGIAFPFAELAILASLAVLGLAVAFRIKAPAALAMGVVGVFALAHGAAHGAEMPAAANALAYGLGFVAMTAGLHGLGILAGRLLLARPALMRIAGGGIALAGMAMLA